MSSWGHGMSLDMVVADKMAHTNLKLECLEVQAGRDQAGSMGKPASGPTGAQDLMSLRLQLSKT